MSNVKEYDYYFENLNEYFFHLIDWENIFAGKAGFPGLRRLNRQQTTTTTTDWCSECYLSKISALLEIFRKYNSSQ